MTAADLDAHGKRGAMSLDLARYFSGLGISVFAIPRPRPGAEPGAPGDGKTPAAPWGQWRTRHPSDAELVAMCSGEPVNLALVTGAISDLVAVDLDSPEACAWGVRQFTYTPWQTRTARGYHLFFRHPGSPVPNKAKIKTPAGRLALDVRGDGGYVIAPSSLHASGAEYQFAGEWTAPRDRVPPFWPGWLARPEPRPAPRAITRPTGDVIERARKYLAAIPRPEIGAGSDAATLYAACRLVRGFGLDASEAEALLWEWAGGRAGWTFEWIARKVRHAERYGTEPIGSLR